MAILSPKNSGVECDNLPYMIFYEAEATGITVPQKGIQSALSMYALSIAFASQKRHSAKSAIATDPARLDCSDLPEPAWIEQIAK